MSLDGATFALIFHPLCGCGDVTASISKAYGTAVRSTIFGRYGLKEQAFGCGASLQDGQPACGAVFGMRNHLHQDFPHNSRHDCVYQPMCIPLVCHDKTIHNEVGCTP